MPMLVKKSWDVVFIRVSQQGNDSHLAGIQTLCDEVKKKVGNAASSGSHDKIVGFWKKQVTMILSHIGWRVENIEQYFFPHIHILPWKIVVDEINNNPIMYTALSKEENPAVFEGELHGVQDYCMVQITQATWTLLILGRITNRYLDRMGALIVLPLKDSLISWISLCKSCSNSGTSILESEYL